jgi:hypothetical protein
MCIGEMLLPTVSYACLVIALKVGIIHPTQLLTVAQFSRLRGNAGDPSFSTCASVIRTLFNLLPLFNPEDCYSLRLLVQLALSTSIFPRPHINRLRLLLSVLILSVLGFSRILISGLLRILLERGLAYGTALVPSTLDNVLIVSVQSGLVAFMVSCLL